MRAHGARPDRATPRLKRVGVRSSGPSRRWVRGWVFLSPLAVVSLLVVIGPSVGAVYFSLTEWTGLGSPRFIGLDNFASLLRDDEFLAALWHNVIWVVIGFTAPVLMGLFGAFMLSRVRRFQILFRVIFFTPVVVSTVVVGAMWKNIFDPGQGIGSALERVGIPLLGGVALLGDTRFALPTIAFISNWAFWGFLVVIFLSAMQSIDPDLFDAVRIDGGGRGREFLHVVLPGIVPTLVFVVLISIVWSFTVFDFIWVFTQGGPAGSTEVVSTLIFKTAFIRFEAGYASAMGLSLTFMSVLVVAGYMLLRRRGWEV